MNQGKCDCAASFSLTHCAGKQYRNTKHNENHLHSRNKAKVLIMLGQENYLAKTKKKQQRGIVIITRVVVMKTKRNNLLTYKLHKEEETKLAQAAPAMISYNKHTLTLTHSLTHAHAHACLVPFLVSLCNLFQCVQWTTHSTTHSTRHSWHCDYLSYCGQQKTRQTAMRTWMCCQANIFNNINWNTF